MPKKENKLTDKQQKFINFYDGNGTQTCRKAGYKGTDKALSILAGRLLGNSRIADSIKKRQSVENKPKIASRQEREMFLTKVMNDKSQKMCDREKAVDILNKMNGEYLQKIELSGEVKTQPSVVVYLPSQEKIEETIPQPLPPQENNSNVK